MDERQKIMQDLEEIKRLQEETDSLAELAAYEGDDKVMVFSDVVAELKEKMKNSPDNRIYSRLPSLDGMTDGFRPGQLIVLSAPTGNGKTAFLQSLTRTFSEDKISCLWFSYEVPTLEFAERFGNDIPHFVIPKKNVTSSLDWLKMRYREGMVKFGAKVIFIDHLHYLLDMRTLAGSSTSLMIGGLMRELKKFAIETETTIFLVSHLTKTKMDEPPTISGSQGFLFCGAGIRFCDHHVAAQGKG